MKYALLTLVVSFIITTSVIAEKITPFTPDVSSIAQQLDQDQLLLTKEFGDLNTLEQRVKQERLTFEELDVQTITELNLKADVASALVAVAGADDLPLGIPGFWWGLCLSWIGILLVYLLMEDSPDRKEQVKNAVIGALVGLGVWLLFWILFWASFAVI